MKSPDAHRKLMSLSCLVLLSAAALTGLAGCGGALLPESQARAAGTFESYDQLVESFDQIVPGMTQAQDLPNLGFDAGTGKVELLSAARIQARLGGTHPAPAVEACIKAEIYCTGYVFHPKAKPARPLGTLLPRLLGRRASRETADVTLLVMNGRVVHKVFSS